MHRLTAFYNQDCIVCGKIEKEMCFISPMAFCNECMEAELKEADGDADYVFTKHIEKHKKRVMEDPRIPWEPS